jgi:uncharacterized membrane protein
MQRQPPPANTANTANTDATEGTKGTENGRVRAVELLISAVLRAGVAASLALVLCGAILGFVRHPEWLRQPAALKALTSTEAVFPHTLGQVFAGVAAGHGLAIAALGLLLLVVTPVLRVAISVLAFLYQRDWAFVVITIAVLLLLLLSFWLGRVGA